MPFPVISFIIPYCERPYIEDEARLIAQLEALAEADVPDSEVVLHVSGKLPKTLVSLTATHSALTIVHEPEIPVVYSAGQARNRAVERATGQYLFFLDVDLLLHPNLSSSIASRAVLLTQEGETAFEMYPCLLYTSPSPRDS